MNDAVPTPVYILLRDNTLALDLVGPAEVLTYANRLEAPHGRGPIFTLHYISAESKIDSSIGLRLAACAPLPSALPSNAMLMLVGCAGFDNDFSSAAAQAAVAWLRQHVTPTHRLLCICTGALLAGHAGLLDGRECTTHHDHYDQLRAVAPLAHVKENHIFVEDGLVCTSAGVTAGIDVALHVVGRVGGYPLAAAVARMMVIYMRRNGNDPQQSPWLAFRNHLHPAIHRVQDAIVENPAADWDMPRLAQIACSSERNLARLFREQTGTRVVEYVQRIRIGLARDLLRQSDLSMELIAERAGFNSTRQLRRVWGLFESEPPSGVRSAGHRVEEVARSAAARFTQ